jgi:hypothetical protein
MWAFKGLLKKDFYISRLRFMTWTIILFIAIAASFVVSNYIHEPMVTVGFLIMLMVSHFGFLPLMVLSSIKLEGKTQLWLHNPQSSKALFLSKLAVSFIYQVISQCILVILTFIIYKYVASNNIHVEQLPIADFTLIHLFILLTALYFSCWILFYWSIYHSLGKFPGIKKIRWLILVFMFIFFNSIETLLMKIEPLKRLFSQWKRPLYLNQQFHYDNNSHAWNMYFDIVQIPLIPIIIYAVIAVALYLVSCWLLDRKVEV